MRVGGAGTHLSNRGPGDTTPRGRLVAHSLSIRDVLANQFGTAWRAKTTEELAAEPRLAEVLGPDQLHESLERELATWEPRLTDLKKKIQAKPEGRPKNKTVPSAPRGSIKKIGHAETARATTR
jgi:hypothetical protein